MMLQGLSGSMPNAKRLTAELPTLTVSESATRLQTAFLLAVLLALGTAALYASSIRNGFINYDDPDYVTRNAHVLTGLSWANLVWAFGTENPAANWHPLTWISHMADVSWYGINPSGHHFTNVLLFTLDVVLLFLFLESATGHTLGSAAVASLFAIHPLNVESVAWVAERKAVLSLFLLLWALWAYVWYTRRPSLGRYLCVALLFALALMAKIMVITLPLLLLLLDYWPLQRLAEAGPSSEPRRFLQTLRHLVVEKIPLILLAVAGGWMTLYMHRKEGALTTVMPFSWRFKNAIYSYVAYLGKTIWPSRLSVFYPHPENSLPWWKVLLATLALAGISGLVLRFREKRYLAVGWLWYLVALSPMIGIVQSGRQGMADRYACISLLGLFLGGVWLLGEWTARFHLNHERTIALFLILMSPYVYLTHRQIGYWHDSYTLFTHALEVTKNNGVAENNLGAALVEMREAQLAKGHLETAVRLIPELSSAHYNLGIILQSENQPEASARQYQLAIAFSVDQVEKAQAHNNLGVLFLQSRNFVGARKEFSAAIALNPREQNSYIGRGMIEQQFWEFDAAIADFSRAIEIAPTPLGYFWLGKTFESKDDFGRAERAYLAALQLAPGMTDAQARLEALRNKPQGGSR
jgi:tetratricopeptide (TPR) repeat protein